MTSPSDTLMVTLTAELVLSSISMVVLTLEGGGGDRRGGGGGGDDTTTPGGLCWGRDEQGVSVKVTVEDTVVEGGGVEMVLSVSIILLLRVLV